MRRVLLALILLATLAALATTARVHAQARPTDPRDLVLRGVQAIGGEAALRDVRTIGTRFTSTTFGLGQEETWASPARPSIVNGQMLVDHAKNRRAISQELRPAATPSGAVQSRQVVTGEYGANETNGTWAPMAGAALGAARRAMREQPERLLLLALDNNTMLRAIPSRTWREETLDGVRIVIGSDSVALYFDRITGRPTLAVVLTDDAILGDRTTETLFGRWTRTGPVLLPRQVDVSANGRPVSTTVVFSAEVNGTVDETWFGIDGALVERARVAATTAAAPLTVTMASLAAGLWRAEGSSHHSLVVEQGNGLLLIEAPQSAPRMRALLDTLASRFPGRAVTQAVNTHHHWDHSSGVRETMARGIPILTHERNVAFVNRIAAAPKTVAPDALSRGGRRPAVRAVPDTLVIGSGASMVVIYPIPTVHVEGILAAFVPSAGVLFTSDVLNPPATPGPALTLAPAGAAELVAFAKARGLAVKTYAGGHGVTVPWADVERAAAR